jgi:hypothetical protein
VKEIPYLQGTMPLIRGIGPCGHRAGVVQEGEFAPSCVKKRRGKELAHTQ